MRIAIALIAMLTLVASCGGGGPSRQLAPVIPGNGGDDSQQQQEEPPPAPPTLESIGFEWSEIEGVFALWEYGRGDMNPLDPSPVEVTITRAEGTTTIALEFDRVIPGAPGKALALPLSEWRITEEWVRWEDGLFDWETGWLPDRRHDLILNREAGCIGYMYQKTSQPYETSMWTSDEDYAAQFPR